MSCSQDDLRYTLLSKPHMWDNISVVVSAAGPEETRGSLGLENDTKQQYHHLILHSHKTSHPPHFIHSLLYLASIY